jgi:hypothetical protein
MPPPNGCCRPALPCQLIVSGRQAAALPSTLDYDEQANIYNLLQAPATGAGGYGTGPQSHESSYAWPGSPVAASGGGGDLPLQLNSPHVDFEQRAASKLQVGPVANLHPFGRCSQRSAIACSQAVGFVQMCSQRRASIWTVLIATCIHLDGAHSEVHPFERCSQCRRERPE